jgi:hypothetical protein
MNCQARQAGSRLQTFNENRIAPAQAELGTCARHATVVEKGRSVVPD